MEKQYQQITNIIHDLAAANPYITKEQIAKAKSMYNGDMRPLEDIRAELEAYSAQILEQGKKAEADREKFAKMAKDKREEKPSVELPKSDKEPVPEQEETLISRESQNSQLQSMIDEAFSTTERSQVQTANYSEPVKKESGKVYVKENNQPANNVASSNDGGFGNINALLSLSIIFSIVTIIIAFFTIISK